jgi:hypothetical protein
VIGARGTLERADDTTRDPAAVKVTGLGVDAFAVHKADNAAGVEGNATINLAEALVRVLVTPGHESRSGVRCQSPVGGLSFPLAAAAISAGTAVDIAEAFTIQLPAAVISKMMGIPIARGEDFKRWSDALTGTSEAANMEERMPDIIEMAGFFSALIPERRVNPNDPRLAQLK